MDTKKLRQKILDLAIHGKLVPQDPNDEPASVLLERIRAEKEQLIKEGKIKKSRKTLSSSDTPHYENVPFEIPSSWEWTTLGEVFTLQAGKNITAKDISDKEDSEHRFPCYGGNGLRGFVCSYNRNGRFPLIGRQGALCGNINFAEGLFYATEHAVVVETYCKTEVEWAVYSLIHLNLNQYATSTAQPGLSVSTINEVLIPLPPIEEQGRIVRCLNKWNTLIDQIEQGKADLQTAIKQTKSKILDLAIHGKLVPQDPNDEPALNLLKRINPDFTPCDNAHYPQLPKSWCLVQLQDLCSLYDGEKRSNYILPYIDVKYLRGGKAAEMVASGKFVKKGSLLILVDGENSGEVFLSPCDGYQGSTFKQLKINNNVYEEYVLLVIQMSRKMLRENKVGSAIPHLDKKIFRAIQVCLPPYQEQIRIVEEVAKLNRLLDSIMERL